ncbi:hypothetical protein PG985_008938 [Apiospora marii]|uniref:Uncharacterized protein n=1 Tax=Apiospora marii TaxID=335849 RepID=A0ABR1RB35_9PEZI
MESSPGSTATGDAVTGQGPAKLDTGESLGPKAGSEVGACLGGLAVLVAMGWSTLQYRRRMLSDDGVASSPAQQ